MAGVLMRIQLNASAEGKNIINGNPGEDARDWVSASRLAHCSGPNFQVIQALLLQMASINN
jgi:hypothetical protein